MIRAEQPMPIDRDLPASPAPGAIPHEIPVRPQAVDIRLLTAEDLAREMQISLREVRRLDREGGLPAPVRLGSTGRLVRWRRSEIGAWQAAGCPPREKWAWKPATT